MRMVGGDPTYLKVYSDDPLAKGLEILDSGIKRIHLVDLEAAIAGRSTSRAVLSLAAALKGAGGFVTVGGGIRSLSDLEEALGFEVDRVVLGTAIYTGTVDPLEALGLGGERLVVAADTRGGRVVHSGWKRSSGLEFVEALERFSKMGFKRFLVTDTRRDGSLLGVDPSIISSIGPKLRGSVIYSGGVSSVGDLEALRDFCGVVVGKAFYERLLGPDQLLVFEEAET